MYVLFRFIFPIPVVWRIRLERYSLSLAHVLYLPIALGLLPYAFCQYSNCWDTSIAGQFVSSILSFLISVTYLVGMPLYLILYIKKHVITEDPEAHEDFLQQKEIEYVLQISHSWLTEKLYLFSSYRRLN